MAQIPYAPNSDFLQDCLAFVRLHKTAIEKGVCITWSPKWRTGIKSDAIVQITNGEHFFADRPFAGGFFSVRIRALATALKNHNLMNTFYIDHMNDHIIIQRIDVPLRTRSSDSDDKVTKRRILIPRILTPRTWDWWKELQDVLQAALTAGTPIGTLTFRGGGTRPIPKWFRDWCREQGIEIEILDPEEFDRLYKAEEIR